MAGKKATAAPGKRASKTAEGAAPRPSRAAKPPEKHPGGRPKGTFGDTRQQGRTERLYIAVTPDQRAKLEQELLRLKVAGRLPANYALSQFLYDRLFPSEDQSLVAPRLIT